MEQVRKKHFSAMECLDMHAHELTGRVIEAILAAKEDPLYVFDKNEVLHVPKNGITTVDASGAFYAAYMNMPQNVLVEKPSDYREHLPSSRFLEDAKDLDRLTVCVLSISEMYTETIFTMLAVPRNQAKLEAMNEFEKPSFREFKVPEPDKEFGKYITQMRKFQKYLEINELFRDWEGRA